MYKRIKTRSDTSCWSVKNNFALPIPSEKQNAAEAMVPDLLKIFKTLLNAFSRVYTRRQSCFKNQQLTSTIRDTYNYELSEYCWQIVLSTEHS